LVKHANWNNFVNNCTKKKPCGTHCTTVPGVLEEWFFDFIDSTIFPRVAYNSRLEVSVPAPAAALNDAMSDCEDASCKFQMRIQVDVPVVVSFVPVKKESDGKTSTVETKVIDGVDHWLMRAVTEKNKAYIDFYLGDVRAFDPEVEDASTSDWVGKVPLVYADPPYNIRRWGDKAVPYYDEEDWQSGAKVGKFD
jgi:hypothetical protein